MLAVQRHKGCTQRMGCASSPERGQQQRRRPRAAPTRINVTPGSFSAVSPPVTPTTSEDQRDSSYTLPPTVEQRSLAIGADCMEPEGAPVRDTPRCVFADERASDLSSFLNRAAELESQLSQKRASALARDISKTLDTWTTRQPCTGAEIHCDRVPSARDVCCASEHAGSIQRGPLASWSQGCRVVQLGQGTG